MKPLDEVHVWVNGHPVLAKVKRVSKVTGRVTAWLEEGHANCYHIGDEVCVAPYDVTPVKDEP